LLITNSCVTTPECETYNYNNVIVRNSTNSYITVDVTYAGSYNNDERTIRPGSTTTYRRMDSGSLWVWANANPDDENGWVKNTIFTNSCQTFTYTWHSYKNDETVLEIGWSDDGIIKNSESNSPPIQKSSN
ncbi:MAG: hypothetical protein ACOC3V_02770, partial [bacterium]